MQRIYGFDFYEHDENIPNLQQYGESHSLGWTQRQWWIGVQRGLLLPLASRGLQSDTQDGDSEVVNLSLFQLTTI